MRFISFCFMCKSVSPAYISVYYVHEMLIEATNRRQIPWTDYICCELSCGCCVGNPGFTREASALIADPSVLPHFYYFLLYACMCVSMWVCAAESRYLGGQRHQMLLEWSYIQYWGPNSALLQKQTVLFNFNLCCPNIHNLNRRIPQVNKYSKDWSVKYRCLYCAEKIIATLQASRLTLRQTISTMDRRGNFRKYHSALHFL